MQLIADCQQTGTTACGPNCRMVPVHRTGTPSACPSAATAKARCYFVQHVSAFARRTPLRSLEHLRLLSRSCGEVWQQQVLMHPCSYHSCVSGTREVPSNAPSKLILSRERFPKLSLAKDAGCLPCCLEGRLSQRSFRPSSSSIALGRPRLAVDPQARWSRCSKPDGRW